MILKMRILRGMLRQAFDEWRKSVWSRDLEEAYCCDGRECGCMGSTVRDVFEWKVRP